MTVTRAQDLYYDPYDIGINADPYPVFKRLREEAPLYYNDQHDFFAVSRECFQLLLWIERRKNFLGSFQSRDHHLLRRDEPSLRARVTREHALRGDISATEILAQKESDARIERAFVKPVHDSASLGGRASWPKQTCRRHEIFMATVVI